MMFSPLLKSDPDYFDFDWTKILVATWRAGTRYSPGQVIRPTTPTGFYAECATAGESGSVEPPFVGPTGSVVTDGSVSWTVKAPHLVTLPTISGTPTYTITPTGITQSSLSTNGLVTRVKLDASAAAVGTYKIVAEVVSGGEDYSMSVFLPVVAS